MTWSSDLDKAKELITDKLESITDCPDQDIEVQMIEGAALNMSLDNMESSFFDEKYRQKKYIVKIVNT